MLEYTKFLKIHASKLKLGSIDGASYGKHNATAFVKIYKILMEHDHILHIPQ